MLLALEDLRYYAHWITPEASPIRFDTHFFLARHPAGQEAVPDFKETTEGVWMCPAKALRANEAGRAPLSPPTVKTIEDLSSLRDGGSALFLPFGRARAAGPPSPGCPGRAPDDRLPLGPGL